MAEKALKSPLTSEKKDKKEAKKSSRKRVRVSADDAAEERRLTALIFGGHYEQDPEPTEGDVEEEAEESNDVAESFFELDRTGEAADEPEEHDEGGTRFDTDDEESDSEHEANDQPAWVDEDDAAVATNLLDTDRLKKLRKSRSESAPLDGVELERRLRKRFQDTAMATARTDWASVDVREKSEDDNVFGSSAAPLLASSFDRLPPQVLSVVRCHDANQQDPNQAVVQAVHFHPGSDPDRPLMLTAGLDKTLRFFQVDAEESQKIHGIHCTWNSMASSVVPTQCISSAVSSSSFSLVDSSKASNIQCFLSWRHRQCLGQWETSLLLLV